MLNIEYVNFENCIYTYIFYLDIAESIYSHYNMQTEGSFLISYNQYNILLKI